MTTLTREKIHERLERVSNLPSIPQVILRIKEITENPKASVADLANAILSDHQLTSRILRMANSAYYGEFSGRITTVTHAIMLMGFRAVRNIAISMIVYDAVNNISKGSGFDVKSFWSRSLAGGVIAKYLAHATKQTKMIEVAFIAGFMHDIGQVVLAGAFPKEYRELCRVDCPPSEIHQTERVLLGIDHLEAGEFIARKWKLPELLIKPIAGHHRPHKGSDATSVSLLVNMVHIAELAYPFVAGRPAGDSVEFGELATRARELLGVDQAVMNELPEICREQVAEIAQDLDIDIESSLMQGEPTDPVLEEIHQQLTNKDVQLAFLQSAAENLMQAKSDEEILLIVCEAIYRGLTMGRVVLFEYAPDDGRWSGRLGFGIESQEQIKALAFPADVGLFGYLRDNGRPLSIVDRNAAISKVVAGTRDWSIMETTAFAAVPIKILDKVEFVIFVDAADRTHPIDDERLRSVSALANQASMALERNLLRRKLAADPE